MNRDDILNFLTDNLKPKRVAHSLGVEKAARELARRYGCDEEQAALAGLTHDCAKGMGAVQMAAYAADAGFPMDEIARHSPQILHAPAGAMLARRALGIADEAVLGAIFWHTVPKPGMSTLEKIVSVADMTEENRDYDGVESVRRAARTDLEAAFRLSLGRSILHVVSNNLVLHPATVQVYNELCLQVAK